MEKPRHEPDGCTARQQFERYTQGFLPTLYRTARRLARQPADADDLVHDTYVKAFQAFPTVVFETPEACRAWLYRILVNTYRDRYRRRQQRPEDHVSYQDGDTSSNVVEFAASRDPGPAELMERKQFAAAAEAAIAALAPEVRLAVTLFFIDGRSYKEIADIAGCPIGTVMSRLSRGRRLLRQRLQDHAEPTRPPVAAAVADMPGQRSVAP